jgi:uncharacterized protein (DUF302 family)
MIGASLAAFAIGAIGMAALTVWAMRNYMIRAYRMNASYETVCHHVEKAIRSVPGWGHPLPDWDFHEAVSKTHYFDNLRKKRIFFVCKAEYANRIVDAHHHMGAMMPCAWSVYETQNGQVFVAKMNISLMSKLFAGSIIGNTMSKVGREEHQMLSELRRLIREATPVAA